MKRGPEDGGRNKSEDEISEAEFRLRTRRSFIAGGIGAGALTAAIAWIATRRDAAGIPWPLRRILNLEDRLNAKLLGSGRIGPEPKAPPPGTPPRLNGDIGLDDDADAASWTLTVEGAASSPSRLSLEQLRALPRTETTTQFKCIEGWSTDFSYAGVRLSDLLRSHGAGLKPRAGTWPATGLPPRESLYRYVGLETPDRQYYVSIDMESALHPQTLVAYEMNGAPLASENGAPARLMIPVKYGIKSLKRLGRIFFSDARPPDYWAERGYDWYSGL